MSAQRKMDIRGFFTSVRKSHHLANLRVQTFADEEKAASEAARKILRQETIAKQNEANRMAYRKNYAYRNLFVTMVFSVSCGQMKCSNQCE